MENRKKKKIIGGGTWYFNIMVNMASGSKKIYKNYVKGEKKCIIEGKILKKNMKTSLENFKQFLEQQYNAWTPVIVLYPLATPTTETVAGQTMDIPAGNSTIEITQASIDNLWLYAKYKATA